MKIIVYTVYMKNVCHVQFVQINRKMLQLGRKKMISNKIKLKFLAFPDFLKKIPLEFNILIA